FLHNRTLSPRHQHLRPKSQKCYPCVRYETSPMSQAAHTRAGPTPVPVTVGASAFCRARGPRARRSVRFQARRLLADDAVPAPAGSSPGDRGLGAGGLRLSGLVGKGAAVGIQLAAFHFLAAGRAGIADATTLDT